jgi:hypothetical protein
MYGEKRFFSGTSCFRFVIFVFFVVAPAPFSLTFGGYELSSSGSARSL